MSFALKPALPQATGNQVNSPATPSKTAVATSLNHNSQPIVGQMMPQNANSHNQGMSVLGQNAALLTQNAAHLAQNAAHLAQNIAHPSQNMTHITQTMAQMAHNMSNHGNLSHIAPPQTTAHVPNFPVQVKKPTDSSPLSLVQDKATVQVGTGQPLALTRTLDKKDSDLPTSSHSQSNGTGESPKLTPHNELSVNADNKLNAEKSLETKSSENAEQAPSVQLDSPKSSETKVDEKQNKEGKPSEVIGKENVSQINKTELTVDSSIASKNESLKPDEAAKTKIESNNPVEKVASPELSKSTKSNENDPETISIGSETNEKSNSSQELDKDQGLSKDSTDSISVSSNVSKDSNVQSSSETQPSKSEKSDLDAKPKSETEHNASPKKTAAEKPSDTKSVTSSEGNADSNKPNQSASPVITPKKIETKPVAPKSTLKLATVTPTSRKRRQESKSPAKPGEGPSPTKRSLVSSKGETPSTPLSESRASKRNRTKVQPYQSPTPELAMATKLSASAGRSTPTKQSDDKLIVFYKNEYLAVRNAEGGFYVCQAMQNVYRSSRKIKIRWLSQDKTGDASGETYKPDFYDVTDMECVLTTLSLSRSLAGGGAQILSSAEAARAKSILDRALVAEQSGVRPENFELTEEHPDGLDLSLYTDEAQLDKKKGKSRKRRGSKSSSNDKTEENSDDSLLNEEEDKPSPRKRSRGTPRKASKGKTPTKAKTSPGIGRKGAKAGSGTTQATPSVNMASSSKTATVPVKASPAKKAKSSPQQKTPSRTKAEVKTPKSKTPKKSDKGKLAQIVATPSTSTGKATRTPRKPPSKK